MQRQILEVLMGMPHVKGNLCPLVCLLASAYIRMTTFRMSSGNRLSASRQYRRYVCTKSNFSNRPSYAGNGIAISSDGNDLRIHLQSLYLLAQMIASGTVFWHDSSN